MYETYDWNITFCLYLDVLKQMDLPHEMWCSRFPPVKMEFFLFLSTVGLLLDLRVSGQISGHLSKAFWDSLYYCWRYINEIETIWSHLIISITVLLPLPLLKCGSVDLNSVVVPRSLHLFVHRLYRKMTWAGVLSGGVPLMWHSNQKYNPENVLWLLFSNLLLLELVILPDSKMKYDVTTLVV